MKTTVNSEKLSVKLTRQKLKPAIIMYIMIAGFFSIFILKYAKNNAVMQYYAVSSFACSLILPDLIFAEHQYLPSAWSKWVGAFMVSPPDIIHSACMRIILSRGMWGIPKRPPSLVVLLYIPAALSSPQ